jgi:uncharacterized protein YjbI with pentapeptide repeats
MQYPPYRETAAALQDACAVRLSDLLFWRFSPMTDVAQAPRDPATALSPAELIEAVANGPVRGISLAGGDYTGITLAEARFEGVDASGACFEGANLKGSTWQECRLEQARFAGAMLDGSSFVRCEATAIDCRQAVLESAWLQDSNFTAACFERARLDRIAAQGCQFGNVQLPKVFGPAWLADCQFAGLQAQNAEWVQVQVVRGVLPDANFARTRITQGAFNACTLSRADFTGVVAPNVSFWQSRLESARFIDAQLPGAILDQAVLVDADFSRAVLDMARLAHAQAAGARFVGAQMGYTDAPHLMAAGADFSHAQVAGMNLHGAQLDAALWRDCDRSQLRLDDPVLLAAERWQPDPRWQARA